MTVRLLVPAVGKQANALYTSTAAAERALIDAGQADRNLDASFEYQTLFGPSSWLAPPVTSGPSLSLSTSTVASGVTGNVAQLASSLSGNVTYSKVSGAASVAVSSVGAVTLSAGLASGATATFIGRGQNDAGDAIERSLTLTGVSSGVTPTPTPTFPVLGNTGMVRLFGAQVQNAVPSIVADGASGVGNSWVNKLQVPGPAIGARLVLYNPVATNAEMRDVVASIALTERGAIDTVDNAYSAWSGGTKHNAVSTSDALGFKRFTWNSGGQNTSPILPRTNSNLPSFGYNNQHTYVVSDMVTGLTPLRATDRTKEEYYAILRYRWNLNGGDGIPVVIAAAVAAAQKIAKDTDRADYPMQFIGRADPSDSVLSPSSLPSDLSLGADSAPCMAVEYVYPAGTKAITIWGVGDSITESYRWWQIGYWRNSKPSLPIHTFNIGGSTTRTESYLGNMWLALQTLTKPDYIQLPSMSINNYSPSSDFTMDKSINVEWPRTRATCEALIAEGIGVILWTCYNYGSDADTSTPIGYLNDQARQYAAASGGKVTLLDITRAPGFNRTVYNATTNPTGCIDPDNTHLSDPTGIAVTANETARVGAIIVARHS